MFAYVKHFKDKGTISQQSVIIHYTLMIVGVSLSAYSLYCGLSNTFEGKHKTIVKKDPPKPPTKEEKKVSPS